MYEPGEHAHHGDEEDDLEDAPADEEEAGDCHGERRCCVMLVERMSAGREGLYRGMLDECNGQATTVKQLSPFATGVARPGERRECSVTAKSPMVF